jgi:hypothetical protein
MGMPAKRELSMRQLRHLLRLHHDGVSAREIGRRLGVARSTIQDNLKRATAAGLAWPLADNVTDEVLELRLFGHPGAPMGQRRRTEPDWAALAREQKRPGVTMMILWEEYREAQLDGYGYSRICVLALAESFFQTRGGVCRGAAPFWAEEIGGTDVPRSGACIANLFERQRPRDQKMRQRQQRPHADPQGLVVRIRDPRQRFHSQIRDRFWDRSRAAVRQPHHHVVRASRRSHADNGKHLAE